MEKTTRQRLREEAEDLTPSIKQTFDMMDILLMCIRTFFRKSHVLGHKASVNKLKNIEIIRSLAIMTRKQQLITEGSLGDAYTWVEIKHHTHR